MKNKLLIFIFLCDLFVFLIFSTFTIYQNSGDTRFIFALAGIPIWIIHKVEENIMYIKNYKYLFTRWLVIPIAIPIHIFMYENYYDIFTWYKKSYLNEAFFLMIIMQVFLPYFIFNGKIDELKKESAESFKFWKTK